MADHVVRAELPSPEARSGDLGMAVDRALTGDDGFAPPAPPAALPWDDPAIERALLLDAQHMARMGSWSFDTRTGEVYLSDGLRRLMGLTDGCSAADALNLIHPDDLPVIDEFRERLRVAEAGETIDLEIHDSTGSLTFLVRGRPERDADGTALRVHGTVQDVTRYRVAEQQASQDRRLFGDAQRVARLGTWEWNSTTGEFIWSTMLYELFGVEPGTPVNYADYLDLLHPDDRGWVHQRFQELATDGRPVEVEYRVVRPDGARRVFRCRGEPLGPDANSPIMIGTAQDVTEQRSTETRMMRSSQRFTDLVSITPVGIALLDDAERLVDANEALCQLLGVDLERLRGMPAAQLVHPSDRGGRLLAGRNGGRHGSGPFRVGQRVLSTAGGKPVYCELSATVSVADDGQRFWLVVFSDVTDRRRAAERLHYQATHDELTGLPGRPAVKELLAKLLGGPEAESVALLFCDVDNFKRFNDSLGHDVGDELIAALARRLERGLPPGCTAARMSGDEYVVICSDVNEVGGVEALATKVSALLRTAVPVRGQLLRVSAAIGAAVPAGPETSAADLLRFADAAMFDAKRRGTGRVSVANAEMIASATSQMLLEGQLRDAIGSDGLVLHYQPVVGPDGTVLSAEALVRWPHPQRGLLAPGEFLPVAEQGDLLRDLDRWVLKTALREAAKWPLMAGAVLGGAVSVAVNMSGLVPGDPEFVEAVAAAVIESGIEWDRVVLELVETSLIDLPQRSRAAMVELADRGIRFAVDDFGTGYSSLARLKELPAQIIKVDRRFVAGVASDASDFAVARAVVDMARAMGRSCVAEGVENATQFHVLRSVGVEAYQGWLLSRPVPAVEFRELLRMGPLHIPQD
ncbi:MAG TPA: EAL domain-containing protein [Actinophytocola sp.]|uniref:sensor domain-containing protein n=1 Tax=Actinophytocola sp. TaxID=1872138 RepID=UPI002DBB73FE|nr:EAL domain-containing protein [Actinophytocola sp.]HEU5473753.1 EAL domain-containing protein [Actinophytocola sp.]